MEQPNSLRKKTIRGMLWSFGDLMGNQGMQFLIQIVLARMLLPEHFGLIGMILVFVAVSNSIIDSGFTQALVREPNADQTDYSTVFYFNLAVSICIYVLLYFTAPAISGFYSQPELISIIRVLALGIIINALAIVPRAMYTKDVDFKVQMQANLSASLISGAVAIGMAFAGFGVWSLVSRTLAMNGTQTLFLIFKKKWLPSLEFSGKSFKRLFGFGWKLLLSGIIDTIFNNIYYLIIGKQYSAMQLGYYTNASRFSDIATQTLTSSIARVSYPVLSSIQEEQTRLKQSYKQLMKIAGYVIFPILAGLAAIGEPLVRLLFGEQWVPMTLYFQLLCIAGMLYPIHALNLSILQVKGRSDLFLYLEILKTAIFSALIVTAIVMNAGILGLIAVVILNSYLCLFINTYFSAREIAYPVFEQLRDLAPLYVLALSMSLVVYTAEKFLPFHDLGKLAVLIILGVLFYITGSKILRLQELPIVYNLLLPLLKKFTLVK
ncbi:lipopolysaccharide biosynthesis protein [Planococcus shenhongbingii]|uniref:Lipopolysaccharide biosynthesis protein n=1 Tax=Planococcus shenhongbingii TaxID=3058398 RepID=A0ABT8N9M8_9BACL|nr:lipopolysaccharide biosynthesis protein [Planococcus sp. N017]MDN7244592.1 lipopolysaccharide biosynthesis protein [Planococcus sp. N017]